jgi:hypothetical protein
MLRQDYRKLLAALHVDHNTYEHAREMFELVKRLEDVLVKPDDPPSLTLPTSAAGLAEWARQHRSN